MAQQLQPLPKGVTPTQAGRFGLWLLGLRQHKAAQRRIAFPKCAYAPQTLVARWCRLIVPWKVFEYPGSQRMLSELCGISLKSAERYHQPSAKLPRKQALRLSQYLEQHASACEALARELRAYAAANAKPVRKKPQASKIID